MKRDGKDNRGAPGEIVYAPTPETLACWKCGADIPFSEAGGACPSCGAALAEHSYDEEAGRLLGRSSALASDIGSLMLELGDAVRRNERLGVFARIPFLPSRRRVKLLEAQLAEARAENKAVVARIKRLAVARYYVSAWYRMTGIPLSDLGRPGDTPFGSPRYQLGRNGEVRFECKAKSAPSKRRGFVNARHAEYEAFCEVQRIVDSGALGHARLLANLIVPYDLDERQRYRKRVRSNEMDAVLVTERAVVVIEVKWSNMAVVADYSPSKRRHRVTRTGVTASGEYFGSEQEDHAIGQAVSHCRTLSDAGVYSIGTHSLVGLVVFVGAPRVNVRCEQGAGTMPMYFAALRGEGPDLASVLSEAVSAVGPERSADEVDVVADELFARFADLDGSKAREHRERIERERVERRAGPRRAVKRRNSGTPGTDAELERMMRQLWS